MSFCHREVFIQQKIWFSLANRDVHNGGWKSWQPLYMCGPGIRNSTVGIVGFGRIAQEVAKRLIPFKPKRLIYSNRSASRENEAKEIGVERVTFEQLLASSDFVILVGYQGIFFFIFKCKGNTIIIDFFSTSFFSKAVCIDTRDTSLDEFPYIWLDETYSRFDQLCTWTDY